jgi:hypothetical protein
MHLARKNTNNMDNDPQICMLYGWNLDKPFNIADRNGPVFTPLPSYEDKH